MPRPLRLLLALVVIAVVGLMALTWMARRYASLATPSPVHEVAPSAPPPATTPGPVGR